MQIPIYLLTTLLILALPVRSETSSGSCKKQLKIGVSLPLTAGTIASGEAVKQSIILADEQIDTAQCVEFIFQDDQLLPRNTLSNVNRFIDVDRVDGLIVYGTPTSIAVGGVVERKKVPMIALSILRKVVEGKNFIMKHWCTSENLTAAIAKEVARRKYRSVAIVSSQNDAMLGLRDQYRAGNITVIAIDDEFARENLDFGTTIAKIKGSGVDAVYVLLIPPQTGMFVKKLREHGYRGEIFGVHYFEDAGEVEASGGQMVGSWFANCDDTGTLGANYHRDYQRRFGERSATGGANGYDVAKLFIEAAYQDAGLNDYLHTLKNFDGAFGRYGATASDDFNFPAVVKIVTPNGFEKAQQ